MVRVRYGGKNGQSYELVISEDHIVARTVSRKPLMSERPFEVAPISTTARSVLSQFQLVSRFREAGVEVLQAKALHDTALRDDVRSVLNAEPEIEFAGRVLVTLDSQKPVLYTENFFVKFDNDTDVNTHQDLLQQYGLTVKRQLDYARNAYFVSAPEGSGLKVFEIAEHLLQEDAIDLCHPELITQSRQRQAFPSQWHLKPTIVDGKSINGSANVEAAWALSEGEGITIAIVDDGVDLDHEEFRSAGKIVAPRDVTRKTNDPRPRGQDHHGTACAGVACANGNFSASGVAPKAKLMPIRSASALGSQAEADAFVWAARNGADVISCSWGPQDGEWWNPDDPVHQQVVPLPDSTRLAIDFAVTQGRNGKGCVVCFAAGNGNESVDNDGYASYANVIAVAACNELAKRSAYSDFGKAIWCAFPSNDTVDPITPGIWTTDRSGVAGYNPGHETEGDKVGNYTNSFGGTSSACPGVAGVAALILARNPDLRWEQVREILKQSGEKIDPEGGEYDANGRSPLYGFGRVDARRAVERAVPIQETPLKVYKAVQDVPITDLAVASLSLEVPDTAALTSIKVDVDIEHTYIGDLVVTLKPPANMGIAPVLLHDRTGRGTDNIKKTYDEASIPNLASFKGKSPKGTWVFEVADKASRDTGKIRSFTLEISF